MADEIWFKVTAVVMGIACVFMAVGFCIAFAKGNGKAVILFLIGILGWPAISFFIYIAMLFSICPHNCRPDAGLSSDQKLLLIFHCLLSFVIAYLTVDFGIRVFKDRKAFNSSLHTDAQARR